MGKIDRISGGVRWRYISHLRITGDWLDNRDVHHIRYITSIFKRGLPVSDRAPFRAHNMLVSGIVQMKISSQVMLQRL